MKANLISIGKMAELGGVTVPTRRAATAITASIRMRAWT